MFFKLLKDALKVKNVRNKILFTIFIIFVFRVGTHVTVPGINAESLKQLSDLPFLNMLNLVSGNAINNFSIFSMGVSPYITASIIVQLLQMDIYPKFVEWGKQGEVGRRKLNQATRYITLVLAFVQSIGITASFNTLSSISLVKTPNVSTYLLIGTILTAGSIIVTWLGEQITDKGFGNGVSMIIFSGIIASIPKMFSTIYEDFFVNVRSGELTRSYIIVALLIVVGLAIVFFTTFVQSIGITASFNTLSSISLVKTPNISTYLLIGSILTAGSIIVTWLGEQITDKGFGNGVSMIIFSGIIASIPKMFSTIYEDFFVNVRTGDLTRSYIIVALLIVVGLAIVFFTTFVQQAEYQIPIQYTKLVQGAPTSSYLPLKVNPAGVIPVIFASSITTIPSTILPFFSKVTWLSHLQGLLSYNTPSGMIIYAILIILFSFFYTFVQVNPEKTAEYLQKNGSYIPSVRPGRETEKYMSSLLKRLATIGAVFLAFISLAPIAAQQFMHLTSSIALGGTSLLILISTGIEGMKQLEGYLLKRQYVGFMNLED